MATVFDQVRQSVTAICRGNLQSGLLALLVAAMLSACTSYAGRGLVSGQATLEEVIATMGPPAMRWQETNGTVQLAFPRGPEGQHTFMAWIGKDGRLIRIDEVLNNRYFARIVPGQSRQGEVLRLLGPSVEQWTDYYSWRDELVWEWLYCDEGGHQARFNVLFDGHDGPVRATASRPDYRGPDGVVPPCGQVWR